MVHPVSVDWGLDGKVDIADAPTALVYIFTVVQPPRMATVESYCLPLLFIFCQCLHLAFITPTKPENCWRFPVVACVMYTTEPFEYMFGSTFKIVDTKTDKAREQLSKMDEFRKSILTQHIETELPKVNIRAWPKYVQMFRKEVGLKDVDLAQRMETKHEETKSLLENCLRIDSDNELETACNDYLTTCLGAESSHNSKADIIVILKDFRGAVSTNVPSRWYPQHPWGRCAETYPGVGIQ